jgi:hypothetical protein
MFRANAFQAARDGVTLKKGAVIKGPKDHLKAPTRLKKAGKLHLDCAVRHGNFAPVD